MNYSLFRSKTFWTIVAMFVVGGVNAIMGVIPPQFQTIAMLVLGGMASYFHLQTGTSTTGVN